MRESMPLHNGLARAGVAQPMSIVGPGGRCSAQVQLRMRRMRGRVQVVGAAWCLGAWSRCKGGVVEMDEACGRAPVMEWNASGLRGEVAGSRPVRSQMPCCGSLDRAKPQATQAKTWCSRGLEDCPWGSGLEDATKGWTQHLQRLRRNWKS